MAKSRRSIKVREDKHSVYVRFEGWLYRPVFPNGQNQLTLISKLTKDDVVVVRTVPNSLLAIVDEETWYNHGSYYADGHVYPSENCFKIG